MVEGISKTSHAKTHGCLHLIDLAGSERVSRSGAEGKQLLEAQHDFADAHFLLGLIEKKRGDPEAAADCFVLATTFRPDFADAWCQLAAGEIARG